MSTAADVTPLR